jgi:hypothetical protein
MKFNEHWTKEDNDLMRQMRKEGKSTDDIINFFGKDKVKCHPSGKFNYGGVLPYKLFLNELKIRPDEVSYHINQRKSYLSDKMFDYMLSFSVNKIDYMLVLYYYMDSGIESYNILFTTEKQFHQYQEEINKIINKGDYKLPDEEEIRIKKILEKETNYNDLIQIMKKLSFVLFSFSPTILYRYPDMLFSISDTTHPIKIKLYRNIIKDSFKNVKEIISTDEQGKPIYYYKIEQ